MKLRMIDLAYGLTTLAVAAVIGIAGVARISDGDDEAVAIAMVVCAVLLAAFSTPALWRAAKG